jgi:hypothetical protein
VLDKCANPDCPNAFRQLSQGKLFVVETGPVIISNTRLWNRRTSRRVEHYWLCDDCASVMTLSYEKGRGIKAVPLPKVTQKLPPRNAALGEASAASLLGNGSLGRG